MSTVPPAGTLLEQLTRMQDGGDFKGVISLEREALETAEIARSSNPGLTAALLKCLGVAFCSLNYLQKAVDLFEQVRTIAQQLGIRSEEGRAAANIGVCYISLGQYAKAIELLEYRLVIARELGDTDGEGKASQNLSVCYQSLGKFDRAIELLKVRRSIAESEGDQLGLAHAVTNSAAIHLQLGQAQQAIDLYEQGRNLARKVGDLALEGAACGNLGISYLCLSRFAEAGLKTPVVC